jgi:hypothetical protein
MHMPLPQTPPRDSELSLYQDIMQQSPTLTHRTQALEAAYRSSLFDSEVEGVEEVEE